MAEECNRLQRLLPFHELSHQNECLSQDEVSIDQQQGSTAYRL